MFCLVLLTVVAKILKMRLFGPKKALLTNTLSPMSANWVANPVLFVGGINKACLEHYKDNDVGVFLRNITILIINLNIVADESKNNTCITQ